MGDFGNLVHAGTLHLNKYLDFSFLTILLAMLALEGFLLVLLSNYFCASALLEVSLPT